MEKEPRARKVPTNDRRPRVQIDLEEHQRIFLHEHLPWGTQNGFFRSFAAKSVDILRRDPKKLAALVSGSYDITFRGEDL